jgi:hypothetical protein
MEPLTDTGDMTGVQTLWKPLTDVGGIWGCWGYWGI